MTENEILQLRNVIQQIRDARYPDVEIEFLETVLKVEVEAGSDDAVALRQIKSAAEATLAAREH